MSSGCVDVLDAIVGAEFQVLNELKNKVGIQVTLVLRSFVEIENNLFLSLKIKFLWPFS